MKNGNEHMKLRLSRSLFETRPEKSRYQIDILPKPIRDTTALSISPAPYISDIDGLVFIEHNKVYRTLLTGSEFINEEGKIEKLSPDFVIRSGQSGYTSESTTLDVIRNGKTVNYKIAPAQRVRFDADSRVVVKK
jgi:pyruvate/2-oxoglutarate/acetoin dehydrogenase E1 component